MYMPNYTFTEPDETIEKTQTVFHTPNFLMKPLCFIVTIFATICDFFQVLHYVQLYTEDETNQLIPVAVLIVIALDFSMYVLAGMVNELSSSPDLRTSKTKRNVLFTKIVFLVLAFVIAYIAYLILAITVITDSSQTEPPQYFRLVLPALTSALCFAISLNHDPNAQMLESLKSEALSVEEDIFSARNTAAQIDRDFKHFSPLIHERLHAQNTLNQINSQVAFAELQAREALASYLQCNPNTTIMEDLGLGSDFLQSAKAELLEAEQIFNISKSELDKENPTLISSPKIATVKNERTAKYDESAC